MKAPSSSWVRTRRAAVNMADGFLLRRMPRRKLGEQLVGGGESVDADPAGPGRGAHQDRRGVVHLVAAVDVKRALHCLAGCQSARVMQPLRPGSIALRVFAQLRRRVLLGVDRNGDDTHVDAGRTELALELGKRLAGER